MAMNVSYGNTSSVCHGFAIQYGHHQAFQLDDGRYIALDGRSIVKVQLLWSWEKLKEFNSLFIVGEADLINIENCRKARRSRKKLVKMVGRHSTKARLNEPSKTFNAFKNGSAPKSFNGVTSNFSCPKLRCQGAMIGFMVSTGNAIVGIKMICWSRERGVVDLNLLPTVASSKKTGRNDIDLETRFLPGDHKNDDEGMRPGKVDVDQRRRDGRCSDLGAVTMFVREVVTLRALAVVILDVREMWKVIVDRRVNQIC
ncbi:hypothetical protein FPV67DRAFT_1659170 [Lyophyllum atratum]|nr:hypothetical protein FPV67DRAFT_1659170 [Lyophyllum atratum]